MGIYKITSPSGKVYIGQSWNIFQRWKQYGSQKVKKQPKLFSSFQKYGRKEHIFEIVHELPSDAHQAIIDDYEQLYMDLYAATGINLLNIRLGGSRGKHSVESRERMSISGKGKTISEEQRKRISQTLTGTKLSEELRSKLSKIHTGKKKTFEHIRKVAAHSAKLTEAQVVEIKNRPILNKYGHCTALAKEFGMSVPTISAIITGRLWKHLNVNK